jgi:hypothetical protein
MSGGRPRPVSMAAACLRASPVRFPARKALGAPNGLRPLCGRRTRQIPACTFADFALIGFRSSRAAKLREDTRKGVEVLVGAAQSGRLCTPTEHRRNGRAATSHAARRADDVVEARVRNGHPLRPPARTMKHFGPDFRLEVSRARCRHLLGDMWIAPRSETREIGDSSHMSGATEGMASGLHRESRSMPSCVSYRSNFFHARREGRCRRLTDSVEKVGRGCRIRNNRIEEVSHSDQGCALDWLFGSKLRCGTLKIFFQHYRPTRDIRSGHELQASEVQLACQQAMQAACSTQHR